jgi:uncharacterized protein UPF0016
MQILTQRAVYEGSWHDTVAYCPSAFLAEFGDKTQIAMLLRQSRVGVFLASAGALVLSSLPAHVRGLPMKGLRSSLTALCLACCLLMPMGAGGLVLCIGADGHIAFEPARDSRCTSSVAPIASQADHCGPCVDIPLLTSAGDQQRVAPSPPLPDT